MRDFGYLKLSSYFYFLNMLLSMGLKSITNAFYFNTISYLSFFFLFIVMQYFFYSPYKFKSSTYFEMLIKSIKDIMLISFIFIIITLFVNLGLYLSFNFIAESHNMNLLQVIDLGSYMLIFIGVLLLSNFCYYSFYFKKMYKEEVMDKSKSQNEEDVQITMSISKEENEVELQSKNNNT